MAGGCCALRTPRTCSWPAPRAAPSKGSTACSTRSTSSSPPPVSPAARRRLTKAKGPAQASPSLHRPWRSEGAGGRVRAARTFVRATRPRAFLHAQVVLHVLHARDILHHVLGAPLLFAARDCPVERDFAV